LSRIIGPIYNWLVLAEIEPTHRHLRRPGPLHWPRRFAYQRACRGSTTRYCERGTTHKWIIRL